MSEPATETTLLSADQRLEWGPGMPLSDRIQYACGLNVLEGWTNTDYFSAESFPSGAVPEEIIGKVYHADLTKRHPFPDQHFSFAYCEDFIEHLSQKDGINFLLEVARCLKYGGVLRISTPGLHEALYRHYYDRSFADAQQQHYHCYTRWGHQLLYTHDTLRAVALATGFRRYRERVFNISTHPEFDSIDTRAGQIELNIIAELTK